MSVWEFFVMYIWMKVYIFLYIALPLFLILVGFAWWMEHDKKKRKEAYRQKKLEEKKDAV